MSAAAGWTGRRAAALSSVAFADPSLPLVVDLGCGFGTSLLGLLEHGLSGIGACNVLGCDASAAKMAFASGIAARRGQAPRAAFVTSSASEVVAWLGREHEGRLGGVLVQFPTPFAVGSGNSQLPTGDGDGYMLSTELLRAIKDAMTTSDGAFFASSGYDGFVNVYSGRDFALNKRIDNNAGTLTASKITSLDLCGDGLLTGGFDRTVKLYVK